MTQEQLLKRLLLLKEQPDLIKPFTLDEIQELMFIFLNHIAEVKDTVETGNKKGEQSRDEMSQTVAKLEKQTRAEILNLAEKSFNNALEKAGLDKDEIKQLIAKEVARVESQIPQLPDEFDATDLHDMLSAHDEVLSRIEMLTTIENIRNGLESLPDDDKLALEAIAGLPEALQQLQQQRQTSTAIIARSLSQIIDVNLTGLANGQTIVWNEVEGQWKPGSGGGGASTFTALTDTPSTYTGQAGKFAKVNALGTAIEFAAIPGGGDMLAAVYDPAAKTEQVLTVSDTPSFATAVQGGKADSASQPGHTHTASDVTDFSTAVTSNSAVSANTSHRSLTTNPHNVTKAQVGLGSVPNTNFTAAVAANTAKNSYPSGDAAKVNFITVTQPVNLDTMESNIASNNAKVTNATHTGDVTGSTTLTIAANAVTNTKAADMAVNTIKGRITAGTGDPQDLTAANVRTITATETTTQLNTRDTNNRNRANHTGSQAISTVTGLQTELDGKAPKVSPFNNQTGTTYTLIATDAGKVVTLTNAAAITLTVPNSVFSAGEKVLITQGGAGSVTIVAGAGVTLNTPASVDAEIGEISGSRALLFTSASAVTLI